MLLPKKWRLKSKYLKYENQTLYIGKQANNNYNKIWLDIVNTLTSKPESIWSAL